MHVFIPVFFNAPLGGLQSHVRAQVRALLGDGHRCTVMCKPGPFAAAVGESGADVLETGYQSLEQDVQRALEAGPFDLVHAHPFASRKVGQEVARKGGLPFLLTVHGMYSDSLDRYAGEVSLVIAVSPAVRDMLIAETKVAPGRVVVLPNAVDRDLFFPGKEQSSAQGPRKILFVSRMDPDKQFILDLVRETWSGMQTEDVQGLEWLVAGDGSLRESMEAEAERANQRLGAKCIQFVGWQEEPALAELYRTSHLCIAPGRSALDCMACGTPVIAIGSKGFLGLIDETQCLRGMHGNFGGQGSGHQEYRPGTLLNQIREVIRDDRTLRRLGKLSCRVVADFFDQKRVDERLLSFYRMCSGVRPGTGRLVPARQIDRPGFAFHDGDRLGAQWNHPPTPAHELTPVEGGGLRVTCRLAEDEKFYLCTQSADFTKPPEDPADWGLEAGRHYELTSGLKVIEGDPQVQMWVIQYDRTQRIGHATASMREGTVSLPFTAADSACSFKVAFRFSGSGILELSAVELAELHESDRPDADSLRRAHELAGRGDYLGENLVFVLGAPRSGTTWVLNLLKEHPQVVAATLDNLDVRLSEVPSLETNIFNDNRPYTDKQIRDKFYNLSRENPGKVVVEKTPIHLLFVDRIRRVFPRAALVLVWRDGRDVVNSLVQVGRDPQAWWRGAPDTVEKATRLWIQYARAGLRCLRLFHPLQVHYERLIRDPEAELRFLHEQLGLTQEHLREQTEACRGGANIGIPGVFREGKTGSWKQAFSPEDISTFKDLAGDLLLETSGVDPRSW